VRVITPKRADLSIRRLVAGQCQACGKQFFYQRINRPKLFCDQQCRQSDFRRFVMRGSPIDESGQKVEANSKTFRPDFADRPSHIVAGPQLSPFSFRAASVAAASVIAANNRLNAKYWEAASLIKRRTPPVNIVGGYKFPNAPFVDLAPPQQPAFVNRGPRS
jgi:hypothetical protein